MSSSVFIFAGGGTGGHVYPGLAVARELSRLDERAKVVFACSDRAIDRRILDPLEYAVVPQPVRPLPRGAREVVPFAFAWWRSRQLARALIADLRPAAVLGLGGFAAGPVICCAAKRGIPTALLNPDAVPGKANLYLARHADVIFTQFASTVDCFGAGARRKVRHVGCPVRGELLGAGRAEAVRRFNLLGDRKTLLVLGGSLGAATINDAIEMLAEDLDELCETWQVLHVTGPAKAEVSQAPLVEPLTGGSSPGGSQDTTGADASPPANRILVRRMEYCHQMDLAYAAADLVLARAGAGTVAELSAAATPAVLMPYPYHADQHQRLNAAALADAGAAVICDDARDAAANAQALRGVLLGILRDQTRLQAMRRAAGGFAKPHAAADVAAWLVQCHKRQTQ